MSDDQETISENELPANAQPDPQSDSVADSSTPGCMPAVVAGTLIMGMVAAILCGVTTWVLFQKRAEIAVRTLEGFVPVIEQSLLEPKDKSDVIDQFEALVKEMSAPDYPPATAAAVMQRVVRLPIPHWGELDAVEAYVKKNFEGVQQDRALTDLSRLRRAVQQNKATVFDVVDVLEPVAVIDDESGTRTIRSKLTDDDVEQVVERAGLLAARAEIEDKRFPPISMGNILRQEIKSAKTEGGY